MQPYGGSKAANEAHLLAMAHELDGTGVTANVLVPGGAADTRLVSRAAAPDRSKLISPDVMVAPLLWLCSNASDGVTGQRFVGASWDQDAAAAGSSAKGRRADGLATARPPGGAAGQHAESRRPPHFIRCAGVATRGGFPSVARAAKMFFCKRDEQIPRRER